MARVNPHYSKLAAGYLFPEIGRRVAAFQSEHSDASLIRLGIGDVVLPLPDAVRQAMHSAVDELGTEDGFHGYGPEQGYEFLRQAIAEGDFETWVTLAPTLMPLFEKQVGMLFLPWSDANSRCLTEGGENFSIELAGKKWSQKPQKYHARSLAAIRKKYAAVADNAALDELLGAAGCLSVLKDAV